MMRPLSPLRAQRFPDRHLADTEPLSEHAFGKISYGRSPRNMISTQMNIYSVDIENNA